MSSSHKICVKDIHQCWIVFEPGMCHQHVCSQSGRNLHILKDYQIQHVKPASAAPFAPFGATCQRVASEVADSVERADKWLMSQESRNLPYWFAEWLARIDLTKRSRI